MHAQQVTKVITAVKECLHRIQTLLSTSHALTPQCLGQVSETGLGGFVERGD